MISWVEVFVQEKNAKNHSDSPQDDKNAKNPPCKSWDLVNCMHTCINKLIRHLFFIPSRAGIARIMKLAGRAVLYLTSGAPSVENVSVSFTFLTDKVGIAGEAVFGAG